MRRPSSRVLAVVGAAMLASLIAAHSQFVGHALGGDYLVIWRATHVVLDGGDPYQLIRPMPDSSLAAYWFYPLPAVGFGLPFVWLSAQWAAVAFAATSAGLLAYAMHRLEFPVAPIVFSAPFVMSSKLSQTGMMTMALALIPVAAGLSVMKPTIGLALFLREPRWRTALTGGALLLGSVLVAAQWPREWREIVHRSPNHHAPVTILVGPLLLLAVIRWRQPAARLLLAMALIPHGLFFYDELPLWLVAKTRREAMALTWCSWLAVLGWIATSFNMSTGEIDLRGIAPWTLCLIYVPALIIVLRRPNAGGGADAAPPRPSPPWGRSRARS